jgi:hypothetical protein
VNSWSEVFQLHWLGYWEVIKNAQVAIVTTIITITAIVIKISDLNCHCNYCIMIGTVMFTMIRIL